MESVFNLYKPISVTPFELINKLKKTYPEYSNIPLGYAGRLDPMADGVLIILVGQENKKRKEYERLSKKYTFEVLFGISTDTYDIMGMITHHRSKPSPLQKSLLCEIADKYIGTWEQTYPPFSSPRVNGKPLFYWARNNALDTIEIPKKNVTVNSLKLVDIYSIHSDKLYEYIKTNISQVHGNFRQEKIIPCWKENLHSCDEPFIYARFEIESSSGLYVRSLAHDMGQQTGAGAIALSITRTAVGNFPITSSLHIMGTSEKKG